MTCATCTEPAAPGSPFCDDCAAEREAHYRDKRRHRVERLRQREARR